MKVDRAQIAEEDCHHFTADAAELRIPPGQWPAMLEPSPTMGNHQPFELVAIYAYGGVYRQICGALKLTVYND